MKRKQPPQQKPTPPAPPPKKNHQTVLIEAVEKEIQDYGAASLMDLIATLAESNAGATSVVAETKYWSRVARAASQARDVLWNIGKPPAADALVKELSKFDDR